MESSKSSTKFLAIILLLTAGSLFAQFAGGNGTVSDPYRITSDIHLNNVRNYLGGDKNFKLMNNITLTNYWVPIGDFEHQFLGKFDGNNKKITGLNINSPSTDHIGLFSSVGTGAVIKNLGVEILDKVMGRDYVGGLIGICSNAIITNCNVTGTISGEDRVGGLYGGGLSNWGGTKVDHCYTICTVNGTKEVGGVIGDDSAELNNSYSTGSVTGLNSGSIVGGLVGRNSGPISNCYSTGTVKGGQSIGGLVGMNHQGDVCSSYATGNVNGTKEIGGLVGYNFMGSAVNSYAIGSSSGTEYIGGLIGKNDSYGSVTSCYSIGNVTGTSYTGGLIGIDNGTVTHSYWNIQTSGQTTSNAGEGKTTAQMKLKSTYNTWDFTTFWSINSSTNNGYPKLTNIFSAEFAGGTGTEADPWLLTTAEHLNSIRLYTGGHNSDKFFKMTTDIDLSSYLSGSGAGYYDAAYWLPISNFSGNFNGNKHKITGLRINRPEIEHVGLFSSIIENAIINQTGVVVAVNDSVRGKSYIGCLVGYIESSNATITDCYAAGYITSTNTNGVRAGGLAGYNKGIVNSSYSSVKIKIPIYNLAGGLIGDNAGVVNNCYSSGAVDAGGFSSGGLVGSNYTNGTINNCYASGYVVGNNYSVGGLVGNCYTQATVTNSYWDIQTTGQTKSSGSDLSFGKTTIQMKTQSTYASWNFGSIWSINSNTNYGYPYLNNTPVGISNDIKPATIIVLNNYPNPFNPVTKINYNLSVTGLTKLTIYNTKGELVKTLVNGMQSIGTHSINFDAAGLASGIYLYTLQTKEKSITNHMLLVK